MKIPLVSAVVILDHSNRFLDEAILSVCEQTYPMLEIVVVDDGKNEGVAARIQKTAHNYRRPMRVVKPKGKQNITSRNSARNLGVRRCRGELVCMLDADDVWYPTKIDEQVAVMQRHPEAGMVYGRTEIWQSWQADGLQQDDFFYDLGIAPERVYAPPSLLKLLVASQASTPIISNAMIRHAAFQQVGGFDEDFQGWFDDQVFFAKFYLEFPTYIANANWARHRSYRGRSGLGPHFSFSTYYRRRRPFLEWLRVYLPQTAYANDAALQELLDGELSASRHPYWSALKRQTSRIRVRRDSVG